MVGDLSSRVAWEMKCSSCGQMILYGSQRKLDGVYQYRCSHPTCNKLICVGNLLEGGDWWQMVCQRNRCKGMIDTRGTRGKIPDVFFFSREHYIRGFHVSRKRESVRAGVVYGLHGETCLTVLPGTSMPTIDPRPLSYTG